MHAARKPIDSLAYSFIKRTFLWCMLSNHFDTIMTLDNLNSWSENVLHVYICIECIFVVMQFEYFNLNVSFCGWLIGATCIGQLNKVTLCYRPHRLYERVKGRAYWDEHVKNPQGTHRHQISRNTDNNKRHIDILL